MSTPHNLTALVTLLALVLFLVMFMRVGSARAKFDVSAPATTGHPEFERHFRVQMNTLEGLVLFLPSLWLFSIYWNDRIAAGLGLVWIAGRVMYMLGYVREPKQRAAGFLVQAIAAMILLAGALAGAVRALIATGGV